MATRRPEIIKPRCTICKHPDRHAVEMLRVSGVGLDAIAAKFAVHRDAVWRHMRSHVSKETQSLYLADIPLAEVAERAAKEGGSVLNYLSLVRSSVIQQMLLAVSANDGHRVAVLAGRATEVLREIGRVTGELSAIGSLTVNNNTAVFMNSPMFANLEAMLLDRLRGYPDALREVVAGLRELEAHDEPADGRGPPLITIPHRGGFHAAAE